MFPFDFFPENGSDGGIFEKQFTEVGGGGMRGIRSHLYRWRGLIATCLLIYAFIVYAPINYSTSEEGISLNGKKSGEVEQIVKNDKPKEDERAIDDPPENRAARLNGENKERINRISSIIHKENVEEKKIVEKERSRETEKKEEVKEEDVSVFSFEMKPFGEEPFSIENVLTVKGTPFEERMTCQADKGAKKKVILGWNSGGLSQDNLGGCPDWNCEFISDRRRSDEADAVILAHMDRSFRRRDDRQYLIYFSQESPANSGFDVPYSDYFNMSFGFRHDTAAASPYGYTVKLSEKSRKSAPFINSTLVEKKSKAAAWFVSHCNTNSRREHLVKEMQKSISVDIYGSCGPLKCARGDAKCEKMLDEDYHFYITFENSICRDYITEKVWSQGYTKDIIPIVLKRSLAEPYLPPNSFIAVDDFETVDGLTSHMNDLMKNRSKYMEYFNWRKGFKVVFLNGKKHDVLERPWGICQICRLLWENPLQQHVINDFKMWWHHSCERDGELVDPILNKSKSIREEEEGNGQKQNENKPV